LSEPLATRIQSDPRGRRGRQIRNEPSPDFPGIRESHLFALPEGTNVVSSGLVMPIQTLRSSFCPLDGVALAVCLTALSVPGLRPPDEAEEKRP
jgi:hypothetical protein